MNQRSDRAPLEGVANVVVSVDVLAGQGNEKRAGRCLPRVDDDLADVLLRSFTLWAVSS